MNIRRTAALLVLLFLASGCTLSEYGICPDDGGDQAVFDSELIGEWSVVTDEPNQSKDALKVSSGVIRFDRPKDDSKAYLISFRGTDPAIASDNSPSVAHLVPLGSARFLDVLVADPKVKDVQRHMLARLDRDKNTLSIQLMRPEYFLAHSSALPMSSLSVSANGSSIKALLERVSIELPMITAGTSELRKFMEEHASDAELWPAEWAIKLRRPEPKEKAK